MVAEIKLYSVTLSPAKLCLQMSLLVGAGKLYVDYLSSLQHLKLRKSPKWLLYNLTDFCNQWSRTPAGL